MQPECHEPQIRNPQTFMATTRPRPRTARPARGMRPLTPATGINPFCSDDFPPIGSWEGRPMLSNF